MKVNENRHPGSSAFDPPLHRDSSFLYEVTGSNPSRAINSVHPRQARCLSILWKFRHNIRKEHAGERLLTANVGYWSKRFWTNIVSFVTQWVRLWINYSQCLHRWTKSVRNDHTAQAGDLASCVVLYCPHVATIRHAGTSGSFWGHPDLLRWQ